MTATLTFYYALRSPYAWLADRLISDLLPEQTHKSIHYVPYWEPRPATHRALQERGASFLFKPMSRERHFYILSDIKLHARRLGYPLRWPVDSSSMDWEAPHLACLHAVSLGQAGDAMRRALFNARWQEGQNICVPESILILAREAGLNLRPEHLTADAYSPPDSAMNALERGFRHGVFGVPFFVVGREHFWGVDRLPFALREAGLPWREVAKAWMGMERA